MKVLLNEQFAAKRVFCAAAVLTMVIVSGAQAVFAQEPNLLMINIASEPKTNAKIVQAKVLIDAPPGMVWNTMTDYQSLKNILPGYEKSNVIRSGGAGKQVDIAMKVAPFLPTYKYLVQVRENEPVYQITLNRISGDFKSLKAVYRLIPQGNGTKTMLSYTLDIDPGFNLPGSQSVIKSNTEKSLKALERYIEAEARKSLIGEN